MSDNALQRPGFGKLREFFWPIYNDEIKKFIPMGLMMFFILFNYSVLRTTKEALIVPTYGPEIIPFLKGFVTMPAAIIFVILYTKLVNVFSKQAVFHGIVAFFMIYVAAFAFVLYPMKDVIHPDPATIEALKASYPNLQHVFGIAGSWSYTVLYVIAELWGSVMISLLFWQFANQITRTSEAKRFYAMFGLLANFALILSGISIKYFSSLRDSVPEGVDPWGVTLEWQMSAVVLAGIFVMYIYYWINSNVLTDPKYYSEADSKGKPKKKKAKLSVGESFKYLLTSKYLGYIALLVLAYGISINLIELVWKKELQQLFPNKVDYNNFYGDLQLYTGFATILLIMTLKSVVTRFGWYVGAIMTPLTILVTGAVFYMFAFMDTTMSPIAGALGVSATLMAVAVGTLQQVLSKGVKYSLFDPTKEMSYIPLDEELKVKGKAAVDVIGGRLGKAGGGYVSGGLLVATAATSLYDIALYLVVIVATVLVLWIFAVGGLNKMYQEKLAEKKAADAKK